MEGDADDRAALWAAEVEAIACIFDEATCRVDRVAPPRTTLRSATTFLRVTLCCDCSENYPDSPPTITLTDARGLNDGRRSALLAHVRGVAAAAAGDCALALVADAAAAALAAAPGPDGDCPLCLGPLTADEDGGALTRLVRLACWHSLHAECAGAWWRAVTATPDGAAAVTCPTCRDVAGPLPPAARAKLDALAAKAGANAAASAVDDDAVRHGGPRAWGLDECGAQRLAAHAASVQAGLAAQAAVGGVVRDRAVTLDEIASALAATTVDGRTDAPPAANAHSTGERSSERPPQPPPAAPATGRGGGRRRGRGRGRRGPPQP